MVDTRMFIPKTIKVGYQKRGGTYTGRLAYVIYYDNKGTLRKEKSWNSWRTHNQGSDEFENEPTSGFVLNKKVGGARESWGHWTRNEYVRVYDPRNFEFEISVPNLLFILQECSSIKGKGLEGEFVYAWQGTELVLLPVDCEEYKECVKHTERQKIKFDKNDMKEGYSYLMKDGTEVLYLGHHNYNNKTWDSNFNPVGKKHIFRLLKQAKESWREPDPYLGEPGFTKIAERTSSSVLPQYPKEHDKFKKSIYCGDIKSIKLSKVDFSDNLENKTILVKEDDGKYYLAEITREYSWDYYNRTTKYRFRKSTKPFVREIKNGSIKLPSISKSITECTSSRLSSKNFYTISVITEKGKSIRIGR